jgi:F420-dependent oxidoreductase-like protein
MRFGFNVHYSHRNRGTDPDREANLFDVSLAAARAAEETGFDSVWYSDHFMFAGEGGVEVGILECFSALAALAARTNRVKLGPYVAGVPYRNPALTAKMFSSLDIISHGRSIVALGAAWHEPEFDAYGWPFPPVRERMELLEDTIHIIEQMMQGSPASYAGNHHSISGALNYPPPVQRPRPPLMIGGGGEKRTLRLVARYADMANIWGGTPDYVAHKFDVLRRHCDEIGRPYDEITRSNHLSVLLARNETELTAKRQRFTDFPADPAVVGTPEQVIARLREYIDAGSQYIIVDLADWQDTESIYAFAESVMSSLGDL